MGEVKRDISATTMLAVFFWKLAIEELSDYQILGKRTQPFRYV